MCSLLPGTCNSLCPPSTSHMCAFLSLVSRQVKMSEAIYDMTAYSRLTDGVLHQIMLSSNPELEKVLNLTSRCNSSTLFLQSKQLILQIEKRRLYKCVGQTQPSRDMTLSEVYTHEISVLGNYSVCRWIYSTSLLNLSLHLSCVVYQSSHQMTSWFR